MGALWSLCFAQTVLTLWSLRTPCSSAHTSEPAHTVFPQTEAFFSHRGPAALLSWCFCLNVTHIESPSPTSLSQLSLGILCFLPFLPHSLHNTLAYLPIYLFIHLLTSFPDEDRTTEHSVWHAAGFQKDFVK